MPTNLDDLGISILEPMLVEHYYNDLKGVLVQDIMQPNARGMILDLNSLPTDPINIKEAVIRWLISVNLTRLNGGDEPIVTLDLLLKCPVWKVISPPLKYVTLTKDGMFQGAMNKPKPGVIQPTSRPMPGSINKKSS
jgi:hypothetical protein